eukprot:763011-Hanusia_phi.AAC.2
MHLPPAPSLVICCFPTCQETYALPRKRSRLLPVIVTDHRWPTGVFHAASARMLCFGFSEAGSLRSRWQGRKRSDCDLSASQKWVSSNPLFKRIRSRHFRRLNLGFIQVYGTVGYGYASPSQPVNH